jgi:hypothetical protein
MFQQLFDRGAFADNEAPATPFDQWRASDQQAIFRTSEPEIVRANLAQAPKRVHHLPSQFAAPKTIAQKLASTSK